MRTLLLSTLGLTFLQTKADKSFVLATDDDEGDLPVVYNGPAIHKRGGEYYINVPDECYIPIKDSQTGKQKFYGYKKLRWEPRTNEIDITDITFTYEGLDHIHCSLKGTHFTWKNGEKKEKEDFSGVKIDKEKLIEKYSFAKKYAPFAEIYGEDGFPVSMDFFLNHTEQFNYNQYLSASVKDPKVENFEILKKGEPIEDNLGA